ncbi:DUF732 domain-containing protein [Mycobacterium sp. Marseille-P9652]|uniref:DUF732 domain-containing protein n=1 Tax=Mycobacterium sp. Marseille-P9652 TaxID=2654950 RepID=UPI0012E842F4|nr:DUF732 domain-containing protein [Mycobacterium sp. Marseille-P9652]
MPRRNVSSAKWSTACAVVLSATAMLGAAPASADPVDDAVIAALSNYGISVDDPAGTIARAHAVCAALDRNQSASILAMKVLRETDMSPKQAGFFIGVSIAAYCPEHRGATDPSIIWMLPDFPFQNTQ